MASSMAPPVRRPRFKPRPPTRHNYNLKSLSSNNLVSVMSAPMASAPIPPPTSAATPSVTAPVSSAAIITTTAPIVSATVPMLQPTFSPADLAQAFNGIQRPWARCSARSRSCRCACPRLKARPPPRRSRTGCRAMVVSLRRQCRDRCGSCRSPPRLLRSR